VTPQLIDILATLCAAVLGIQLTVIVLVWLMDLVDRWRSLDRNNAAQGKHRRANENE